MAKNTPNYRAFARDMMKLCKKHGVYMRACDEGFVILGPAKAKTVGEFPYSSFRFSPKQAEVGGKNEPGSFEMEK